MKKSKIHVQIISMAMASMMAASSVPMNTFAVSGDQVAADGTYTSTQHVTNNPDNDEEWNEYDVQVSLTVENGVFKEITVTPTNGYEATNQSFLNKAYAEPELEVHLEQLPDAQPEDSVIKAYRYATYYITFNIDAEFNKDKIIEFDIWSEPSTIDYKVGSKLDLDGLQIYATDSNYKKKTISFNELEENNFIVTPENGSVLDTAGNQKITIAYKNNDLEAKSFQISVEEQSEAPSKIELVNSNGDVIQTINLIEGQTVYRDIKVPEKYKTEKFDVKVYNEKGSEMTLPKPVTFKAGETFIPVYFTEDQYDNYAYLGIVYEKTEEVKYVMMNIPYSVFYGSELANNTVEVDAVTSATGNKVTNSRFVGGAYINGTDKILGVTFPVKTTESKLEGLTQVQSADELMLSEDYAYAVLSETPAYYKEMTVSGTTKSFGEVQGSVKPLTGATATLNTASRYGDYEIAVDGLPDGITVSGIVLKTTDGTEYGLRHLENIWFNNKLSFSVGHKTTESHGNTLSSAHYASMEGKTLDSITYITTDGIYAIDVDMYLPKIAATTEVSVSNAAVTAGKTSLTVTGLPTNFEPEYSVEGLGTVSVSGDTLSWTETAPKHGKYTLTIKDKKGVYADVLATFILITDEMPAAYDAENTTLKVAEGAVDADFAAYLKGITSVSVNGKSYATGRHGTTIINATTGAIDLAVESGGAKVFDGDGSYEITVESTGYKPLTFTLEKAQYVMMNIPYAAFYASELNNSVEVDAFTSATLQKSRTNTGVMAAGSYHSDPKGTAIDGVTFPVKVAAGVDLSKYTEVTDQSTVTVTVTNKGATTDQVLNGVDALFESASYSYYVLSEAPAYYKEVSVDGSGNLTFGKVQGTVQTVTGATGDLMTESSYGDYQLNIEGFDFDTAADKVYGVVISTDTNDYGLRHVENIWKGTQLAWCTGFTDEVHGCVTDSDHYEAMMGQTIKKVTYYTNKGIFEIPMNLYVPVKTATNVEAKGTSADAGQTTITGLSTLPTGFEPEYSVAGLDEVNVSGDRLSWTGSTAKHGKYTLTIKDKKGVYADVLATFILITDEMPAAYDAENTTLKVAQGAADADFAAYLKGITSVSVNGTAYATGKHGTTIINATTGAIDLAVESGGAKVFDGDGSYEIIVESTGYKPLTFTLVIGDAGNQGGQNNNTNTDPGTQGGQNNNTNTNTGTQGSQNSSTSTNTNKSNTNAVKTGDKMSIAFYISAALVSCQVMIVAYFCGLRKKFKK